MFASVAGCRYTKGRRDFNVLITLRVMVASKNCIVTQTVSR